MVLTLPWVPCNLRHLGEVVCLYLNPTTIPTANPLPRCSDHRMLCDDAGPDLITVHTWETDLKKSYWSKQESFTHGSPLLFSNVSFPVAPVFPSQRMKTIPEASNW